MNTKNGFTLVELAIALMVIGLLIGGVLKGQELIENARVTQTVRQLKSYDAATLIFRNTYNALPGDIKRPNRIPNCTDEACSMAGDGNGRIYDATGGGSDMHEAFNFFPHLTKAGMIQGPEGGTADEMATASDNDSLEHDLFFPKFPFDQITYIYMWWIAGWIPAGNYHYMYRVPGKVAQALDDKIDDGIASTGSMRAEEHADCVGPEEANGQYLYDIANGQCYIVVGAGF